MISLIQTSKDRKTKHMEKVLKPNPNDKIKRFYYVLLFLNPYYTSFKPCYSVFSE